MEEDKVRWLERLITLLPVVDVVRFQRVCRLWRKVGSDVLRHEKAIGLCTYPKTTGPTKHVDFCVDRDLAKMFDLRPNNVLGAAWLALWDDVWRLEVLLSKFHSLRYVEVDVLTVQVLKSLSCCSEIEGLGFHNCSDDFVAKIDADDIKRLRIWSRLKIVACGSHVPSNIIRVLVNRHYCPELETFKAIFNENDYVPGDHNVNLDMFDQVGHEFKRLYLGNRRIITNAAFAGKDCAKVHVNLEVFEALGPNHSHDLLNEMLIRFPNLRTIKFNALYMYPQTLHDFNWGDFEHLKKLAKFDLQQLELWICRFTKDVHELMELLDRKRFVKLSMFVITIQKYQLDEIRFPSHLRKLKLQHTWPKYNSVRFEDAEFEVKHLYRLRRLKRFELSYVHSDLVLTKVDQLLEHCPNLRTIKIRTWSSLIEQVNRSGQEFTNFLKSLANKKINVILCFRGKFRYHRQFPVNVKFCRCTRYGEDRSRFDDVPRVEW